MPPTQKNLAKIHIAKKDLKLADDAYRDALRNITGKDSAAKLTDNQALRVLRYFESRGWRPKAQRSLPGLTLPRDGMSRKIQALWITMHKAGKVRNSSDKALLAMVKRVTGVERLEWCTDIQKSAVIESLKQWAKREGVDVG
jgi:phage gp16-like protein